MGASSDRWYLLYDSRCRLCSRFAAMVAKLNDLAIATGSAPSIQLAALEASLAEALLGQMPKQRRFGSFHLVSPQGSIHSGAMAMVPLLGLLPGAPMSSRMAADQPSLAVLLRVLYEGFASLREGGQCRVL